MKSGVLDRTLKLAFALLVFLLTACCLAWPVHAHAAATAVQSAKSATSLVAAQTADSGDIAVASDLVVSGVNVSVQANVKGSGWKKAVSAGKTAGTKSKKALRGLKVSLTGGTGLSGSVNYHVYARGKGWKKAVKNGASSGVIKKGVQVVKVWLDGDVAKHYDVLYRVYIKGKGWQPWVKNGSKAGSSKKGNYISGIQVKLSPKTEEAAGRAADAVGVRYETRLESTGWQVWKGNGATAGKASKKTVVNRVAVRVGAGTLTGGVQYRAYIKGTKWNQGWKADGAAAGKSNKRIEAVQIKLTGLIAEEYDIYYRTYIPGYKWLDWAKNGATAGANGNKLPVAGLQVVLVKKGAAAPGPTLAPTVALRKGKELDGIDISSWQAGINVANVPADFVIVKATGGTGYTNPYYRLHADAAQKAGKLIGFYHFAREASCSGSAIDEADYFVKAVSPYVGKAILVLDWEAGALLMGPSWAKKFLDRVYAKTGVRPLIYMSKSVTSSYNWSSVAKNYKLWVAQYPNYKKTGYQSKPWTDSNGYGAWSGPTIFQYASTGRLSGYSGNLDLNKFYGTAADWAKLAKKS